MSLGSLTPAQRLCVTTLDAPLVVSAGAGSGKTHMLTQRVLWALSSGSGGNGRPFAESIDQVLVITFTKKSAEELKARVRDALHAVGMDAQAAQVDTAWISTIHGMCSRILRAHFLELGLDPHFKILEPSQGEAMRARAMDDVMAQCAALFSEDLSLLFSEYGPYAKGAFQKGSVSDMVDVLVRKAVSSPEGMGCFERLPEPRSAVTILNEAAEVIRSLRECALEQKDSKNRAKWLEESEHFLENAQAARSASLSTLELLECLDGLSWPVFNFGSKADFHPLAKEAFGACRKILDEAKLLFCQPHLDALLRLAGMVYERYEDIKRQEGVLDNDDLLVRAAKLLREKPNIAAMYERKFKLVMVDEFQDTDRLQLEIVTHLSGPGAQRLCVVGDEQQSIYRFRGADVSVFREHCASVKRANSGASLELRDNFRSHEDVLKFVDTVFGQANAFGSAHMPLAARRLVYAPDLLKQRGHRIDVLHTVCKTKQEDARRFEAARIADKLAELRKAGCRESDMALLLGTMRHAHIYVQALRRKGFSCAVTGGSVFAESPEVRAMARLAQVLANPRDEKALYELLVGDVFDLSADDMLVLATEFDELGRPCAKRSLEEGLRLAMCRKAGAPLSERLERAADILFSACYVHDSRPLSAVMKDVVLRSGWMSCLEGQGPEGRAVAANVLKAIRLVEGFEANGARGRVSLANQLLSHLAAAKEAPGVLSAEDGNVVSVMTIHASKGLEFPVVAIASLDGKPRERGPLLCETLEGRTYVALLNPCKSIKGMPHLSRPPKRAEADCPNRLPLEVACFPQDSVGCKDALEHCIGAQEASERQRLLYVAMTRAKEALIISSLSSGGMEGVLGIVHTALFGSEEMPRGTTMVSFGGASPVLVDCADAAADEQECPEEHLASQDAWVGVPASAERQDRHYEGAGANMTSYSSLASKEGVSSGRRKEVADDKPFWDSLAKDLSGEDSRASNFGTAFHALALRCVKRAVGGVRIDMPFLDALHAVSSRYGLSRQERQRLERSLRRWVESHVARCVERFSYVRPELPFCVALPGHAGVCLEGAMDLFAANGEGGAWEGRTAYIVDYKTGGRAGEGEELLRQKHALQASCYAYAALLQGFSEVRVDFVRVEQTDAIDQNEPQSVVFEFSADDRARLEGVIQDEYTKAQEAR